MAIIAYYRVSTSGQSTDSQRVDIESKYKVSKSFEDVCSGTTKAGDREGFTACIDYIREGDQLVVWDLDRLGRDSIDVQLTIQRIKEKGGSIFIESMGVDLNSDAGELLIVIMSKVAEMERKKILARTEAGRKAAREEGKHMGRPQKIDIQQVVELRSKGASIANTAKELGCSIATVKNLTAKAKKEGLMTG